MAVKKKTELGPKAKLMKKNVDQLKRQAKKLKIQGYSTKKKEQLVNSIMMAEARAKRKPGTKRKKAAAKKPMAGTGSMKRMVQKRGAMPNKVMRKPVAMHASRRPNKPMMAGYNGWSNYETWNMNLWWDNAFVTLVEESFGPDVTYDQEFDVAEYLESFVNEDLEMQNPYAFDNWWGDATQHYLRAVNWREIANSVIDTIQG